MAAAPSAPIPRPAFSTVACPDWPLEQVVAAAAQFGFVGVELRSDVDQPRRFASDPALTDPLKIRRLFRHHGVAPAALATGLRFDQPVRPPVIGWAIADTDHPLRPGRRAIDLAAAIDCPLVRVFAFELTAGHSRRRVVHRIAMRLRDLADRARAAGVQVMLENGGSFCTAADLAELLDAADALSLGACYTPSVARLAGEDPLHGINVLGDRLLAVRLRDRRDGRPVPLGTGDEPCAAVVGALRDRGFQGPLIVEWDYAWIAGLPPPESVLPAAAERLWTWLARADSTRTTTPRDVPVAAWLAR